MNLRRAKFVAAFVVVGVLVVFGITFTASPTPKSPSAEANKEESVVTKEEKILVVCYSFSCGNTRKIAKQLQVALNADYAEIEPVTPYPPYGGWDSEVTRQGQREVEAGYQPEIKPLTINVADYDVIAVGTPTWWFRMAPPMLTFLHSQDWTGKTVIPFMTHGGWPGHVIADIKTICAGAKFAPDMEIQFDSQGGADMLTDQAEIDAWIDSVKKYLQ